MYAAATQGTIGMDAGTPPADAAQSIWAGVKDYLNPVLGLAAALATGLIAYLTARIKALSEEKIAVKRLEYEVDRDTVSARVQLKGAETNEFKVLLESYQRHVDQLTAEVHALRQEVTNLRAALSARLTMCSGCDRFAEWQQNFAEVAKSLEPPRGTGA